MRVIAIVFLMGLIAGPALAGPEVRVVSGIVEGVAADGVSAFKGIPYAAPAVGDLRWRAPRPAAPWQGVRDAREFGPICPQVKIASLRAAFAAPPESEDCLTLNVFTPKLDAGAKLPVMVWIYGGAFRRGGSALPFYDGTELAQRGVVAVTFNYRLGWLGFLAHPALGDEAPGEPRGNYALLDQIAALEWVKRNIEAFGGDPANVTIFGESAGGVSVNHLMISPRAAGLFAKAISQSGSGLGKGKTMAEAEADAREFAARHGGALAPLRALSVDDILADPKNKEGLAAFAPIVDGDLVPGEVGVLFAEGRFNKVPFMVGANDHEASLMDMMRMKPQATLASFGAAARLLRPAYEANGPLAEDAYARELFGDAVFVAPARALAAFAAKAGVPAYLYQFTYVTERRRGEVPGAGHGAEIPYVFGVRKIEASAGLIGRIMAGGAIFSERDRAMVGQVQGYWTQFAKSGNPDGEGRFPWRAFDLDRQRWLVIGNNTRLEPLWRHDKLNAVLTVWETRTGLTVPK